MHVILFASNYILFSKKYVSHKEFTLTKFYYAISKSDCVISINRTSLFFSEYQCSISVSSEFNTLLNYTRLETHTHTRAR